MVNNQLGELLGRDVLIIALDQGQSKFIILLDFWHGAPCSNWLLAKAKAVSTEVADDSLGLHVANAARR